MSRYRPDTASPDGGVWVLKRRTAREVGRLLAGVPIMLMVAGYLTLAVTVRHMTPPEALERGLAWFIGLLALALLSRPHRRRGVVFGPHGVTLVRGRRTEVVPCSEIRLIAVAPIADLDKTNAPSRLYDASSRTLFLPLGEIDTEALDQALRFCRRSMARRSAPTVPAWFPLRRACPPTSYGPGRRWCICSPPWPW